MELAREPLSLGGEEVAVLAMDGRRIAGSGLAYQCSLIFACSSAIVVATVRRLNIPKG